MELLKADEISRLSVTERAQLIGQLWDSLLNEDGSLPEAEKAELVRRLAGVVSEPSAQMTPAGTSRAGMTWAELKAELARRKAEQSDKTSSSGRLASGKISGNLGGIIGPY